MARLTEPTARAAYLALGPGRTLKQVTARLPEGVRVSLKTLKGWSSKFGWVKLAADHDSRVAAKAVEKIEAAQVKETVTVVLALERFSIAGLAKAEELLATGASIVDAAVIVDKALDALKQHQVMTGGVSNRTATVASGAVPGETPEQASARRRAAIEAKYGPLGPEFDTDPASDDGTSSGKPH